MFGIFPGCGVICLASSQPGEMLIRGVTGLYLHLSTLLMQCN
uniref:Uncharacterized protein n=1 Tax=Anguilla anguilla TaxID=7936 RepID=A0A0E9VDY1_ANGAN